MSVNTSLCLKQQRAHSTHLALLFDENFKILVDNGYS